MSTFKNGLKTINELLGTKYVWGGNGAGGVDCSGFTRAVYAAMGIDLPRVSYQQANGGQAISQKEAQPGDLVWWDLNGRNPGADHVGIYMGNGKVAEASSSAGKVVVRNLWGNAQFARYGGISDRGTGGQVAGTVERATKGDTKQMQPMPGAPRSNPLATQNNAAAFGGGFALDEGDRRTLSDLYDQADEDDPGEREDTVGPYHVARLSLQRERNPLPERQAEAGRAARPMLRPTATVDRLG